MEPANTAMVVNTGADDEALPVLQTELQVDLAGIRERLGIPDPDIPAINNELSGGIAEMECLKQAIREQEQAKLEALQEAAELHLQLAAAQVEAAKPKTQYYGVPKSRGTLTRAESELAEMTTQLHATKKELEWEQRSRRAEAIQASTKIKRLENELAAAIAATSPSPSNGRRMFIRVAVGVAAAVTLTAGIAAVAMHWQNPVSASASAERSPIQEAQTQQDQIQNALATVRGRRGTSSATPDFTQSVDRLSQALAALPGRDPEEILRQIQKAGKGCAMRWNGGEPSLLFGDRGKKSASFGDAMTQCAEAVEKLH